MEKLLTDDQLLKAVEMFAQGKSRTQIVQYFIDTDDKLRQRESIEPDLRKRLSSALQKTDPSSNRFAITKYQEHYLLHREAVQQTLQAKYHSVVMNEIETIDDQISALQEQVEALETMLENAIDIEPTGTTEYNATTNALNAKYAHILKTKTHLRELLKSMIDTPEPESP